MPVLLAIAERFDLPTHYFAPDSDARLVSDLQEILADATAAQIEELVARMPAVGQSSVNMHRRLYDATAELEAFHGQASQEAQAPPQQPMPFEEVRDFFYDRKNYIAELDLGGRAAVHPAPHADRRTGHPIGGPTVRGARHRGRRR